MCGLHASRLRAGHGSPAGILVSLLRCLNLPMPPLTVDQIADSTAAIAGSLPAPRAPRPPWTRGRAPG